MILVALCAAVQAVGCGDDEDTSTTCTTGCGQDAGDAATGSGGGRLGGDAAADGDASANAETGAGGSDASLSEGGVAGDASADVSAPSEGGQGSDGSPAADGSQDADATISEAGDSASYAEAGDSSSSVLDGSDGGVEGGAVGDGHVLTTEEIFSTQSADCWSCVQQYCLSSPDDSQAPKARTCETLSAEPGDGGTSDRQLCIDVLDCTMSDPSKCAANGLSDCFCGTAQGAACISAPTGVCKDVELRGLLTTSASVASAVRFGDETYPGGVANNLGACVQDQCCTRCIAAADAGLCP